MHFHWQEAHICTRARTAALTCLGPGRISAVNLARGKVTFPIWEWRYSHDVVSRARVEGGAQVVHGAVGAKVRVGCGQVNRHCVRQVHLYGNG